MTGIHRRVILSALGTLPFGCARPALDDAKSASADLVDLTHTLGPGSPYIRVRDATFPFRRRPIATIETRGVYANAWELTEHIGTHIDAPCHFSERARCLDAIPLDELFAEAVVLDLRERAAKDADTEATLADLETWQDRHGDLPQRSVVLLSTGWDARWSSPEAFANADASGVMHFPGFSRALLEHLTTVPRVLGVGVDTFSIDPGRDLHFEGHRMLAASGQWALECLANLGRLPPRGASVWVGALKVEAASGGPARVVAWVPR